MSAANPTGNQNGATITTSSALSGTVTLSNAVIVFTGTGAPATLAPGSALSNVRITGGTANLQLASGSGFSFSQCSLPGIDSPTGTVANDVTISACAFAGSPEFQHLFADPLGSGWSITDSRFDCGNGQTTLEAIHLLNGSDSGLVISYNEVVGSARNAIEIQVQGLDSVCSFNHIHEPNLNPTAPSDGGQAAIGISWACGPSAVDGGVAAAGASFSVDAQVESNVINFADGAYPVPITAGWSQVQGIEFMGNGGTVARNWVSNVGFNAYTWTGGFVSQDNVWIGFTGPNPWEGEPGETHPTPPTIVGDQSFALGASSIPAPPAAGPRVTPGYQANSNTGGSTVNSLAVTVTDNADGSVTVAWTPPADSSGAVAPTVTIASSQASYSVPGLVANQSSVRIGGIPQNWVITATVAYGSQYSGSAQAQITGGPTPASNTSWSLTVVQPPPPSPPAKTVTHTITVYSDGSFDSN
jgi:hypothetical protein